MGMRKTGKKKEGSRFFRYFIKHFSNCSALGRVNQMVSFQKLAQPNTIIELGKMMLFRASNGKS